MFRKLICNVKLARTKVSFLPKSSLSFLISWISNEITIEQLKMKCMLRVIPSVFLNCIDIKIRELIFVDIGKTLRWIVIDVNIRR